MIPRLIYQNVFTILTLSFALFSMSTVSVFFIAFSIFIDLLRRRLSNSQHLSDKACVEIAAANILEKLTISFILSGIYCYIIRVNYNEKFVQNIVNFTDPMFKLLAQPVHSIENMNNTLLGNISSELLLTIYHIHTIAWLNFYVCSGALLLLICLRTRDAPVNKSRDYYREIFTIRDKKSLLWGMLLFVISNIVVSIIFDVSDEVTRATYNIDKYSFHIAYIYAMHYMLFVSLFLICRSLLLLSLRSLSTELAPSSETES